MYRHEEVFTKTVIEVEDLHKVLVPGHVLLHQVLPYMHTVVQKC